MIGIYSEGAYEDPLKIVLKVNDKELDTVTKVNGQEVDRLAGIAGVLR